MLTNDIIIKIGDEEVNLKDILNAIIAFVKSIFDKETEGEFDFIA